MFRSDKYSSRSIKGMFIYTLLLFILCNIVLTLVLMYILPKELKNYIRTRNSAVLNSISIIVESYYEEKINILDNITKILSIRERTSKAVDINNLLNLFSESYTFFDGIMLLDSRGVVIGASDYLIKSMGYDYSRNDFFTIPHKSGEYYWSKSFVSNETSERTLTVTCPEQNGKFYVVAYINLYAVNNKLNDIKQGTNLSVHILDKNGVYISTDFPEYADHYVVDVHLLERLKRAKEATYEFSDNGIKRMATYKYLDTVEWTAVVYQDLSDVFHLINQVNGVQIFFIFLLSIIFMIISNIILTRFNQVINRFTKSLDAISSGDYSIETESSRIRELDVFSGYFNKMTKAVQDREAELRLSESRFRMITNNVPVGIGVSNLDGDILYVNDKFIDICQFNMNEITTISEWSKLAYPDEEYRNKSLTQWLSDIQTVQKSGKSASITRIYKITTAKKDVREIEISFSIFDNLMYVVFNDLTDIVRVTRELEQTQVLLYRIINSMPSKIIAIDRNLNIIVVNEYMLHESIPVLMVNENVSDLFPVFLGLREKIAESLAGGMQQIMENIRVESKNGTVFYDVLIYPLGTEGAVLRIDDVTEKKNFRELIVETEKMVTIGELAAGMAHEINNPLASIVQGSQNMLRRLSPDMKVNLEVADEIGIPLDKILLYLERRNILNYIEGISNAGKKAAQIVSNMLNFSRKSNTVREATDINKLIDDTIQLALTDYNLDKNYDYKAIKIVRKYTAGLKPVKIRKNEIEQVFLNLIKNAAHALFEKMKQQTAYEPVIEFTTLHDQHGGISIIVRDNGTGMPEDVRKRIFEPFYTTKAVGVGTGLGLTVSYFIITENHHGSISVTSSSGEWTEFKLWLPLEGTLSDT